MNSIKINIIFSQGGPEIIFTRKWNCINTKGIVYKELRETFRMISYSKEIFKCQLEGLHLMTLDVYPGVTSQDCGIILLLLFRGTAILFHSCTVFIFQPIMNNGFQFLCILSNITLLRIAILMSQMLSFLCL